jgi:mRNA-degrading endonuclease RelE of RelBE toxin-antitoxin system
MRILPLRVAGDFMFEILFAEDLGEDLREVPKNTLGVILDKIDEQLLHEPTRVTRNKKMLEDVEPPWDQEGPLWELRVRDYRVFYEVREENNQVWIHAVRKKPPHKTTEEIL